MKKSACAASAGGAWQRSRRRFAGSLRCLLLTVVLAALAAPGGCSGRSMAPHPAAADPVITVHLESGDRDPVGTSLAAPRRWSARHVDGDFSAGHANEHGIIAATLIIDYEHEGVREALTFPSTPFMLGDSGDLICLLGDAGRVRLQPAETVTQPVLPTEPMTAAGACVIELDGAFVDAVEAALDERPALLSLVHAGRLGVSEADVAAYGRTALRLSLHDVIRLKRSGVDAEQVTACLDAGYAWDAEDFLRLARTPAKLPEAVAWRTGGYRFDAEDLVRLARMRVSADYGVALRDAGWELDADQLVRLRVMRVSEETLSAAGALQQPLSVAEIIRLERMRVPMEEVLAYEQAGYTFAVDDLVRLHRMRVPVGDAVRYREAGFNFSVDDLVRLQRYNVEPAFILELAAEEHDPMEAEEIIALRRRNVGLEAIHRIRGERPR